MQCDMRAGLRDVVEELLRLIAFPEAAAAPLIASSASAYRNL